MKQIIQAIGKKFIYLKSIIQENIKLYKDIFNDYKKNPSNPDFILTNSDDLIKDSELLFNFYELNKEKEDELKKLTLK